MKPNKPDAPNPAMTLQMHSGSQWRGVGDLERWAASHAMKVVRSLLLLVLVLDMSGCMTYSTVQCAKGDYNVVTGHKPDEPHPGYYALIPLTVPLDIATSPIQLIYYVVLSITPP